MTGLPRLSQSCAPFTCSCPYCFTGSCATAWLNKKEKMRNNKALRLIVAISSLLFAIFLFIIFYLGAKRRFIFY
jgi:hypothetical protein